MALLTNEQVATLLGRPLSEAEMTSFDQWEAVAESRLNALLCTTLTELSDVEALLLARLFAVVSDEAERAKTEAANYGIESKKIEDYSVNFSLDSASVSPAYASFVKTNADLISTASKCAKIRIGKVRPLYAAYPL